MAAVKLNYSEVARLTADLGQLDQAFSAVFDCKAGQEQEIRWLCRNLLSDDILEVLEGVSVEELKKSRAGIRVSALADAGFTNLKQLALAEDWELQAVDGIGEKQVESIRVIVSEFSKNLASRTTLRLSYEDALKEGSQTNRLVRSIYTYRQDESVRADAAPLRENLHLFIQDALSRVQIRSGLQWFFARRAVKEQTVAAIDDIMAFYQSPFYQRIANLLELHSAALNAGNDAAVGDFRANGAEYYVLIEKMGERRMEKPVLYSSIPAKLAEEIDAESLDLKLFRGTLRPYQEFGTKYILHQKRVLLGDEMGLGKTVQAIAAMSHLGVTGGHFLVVCPASVLVNWCREIMRFSALKPYLLHGENLQAAAQRWQTEGGVAVTNYETLGKIIGGIDNRMTLKMIIIDEAHYIKNPAAKRTIYIHRMEDEAERILLMTGTPLENHVDEFCSLATFLRPDLSSDILGLAHMSHAPQFREALAPLYLRRTRDQVLQELPSIEEAQVWCEMTAEDRMDYGAAVVDRDFASMRRIGFLRGDLTHSAKALRLKELCVQAGEEGRKILVYSFFRDTIDAVSGLLQDRLAGVITGDTEILARQPLIDRFSAAPDGSVLICQVQAGGTGLNIQAASVVIFCEPQIKPSLANQAISRVYRMGQVRNVLVYHLLVADSVDEAMVSRLAEKQAEFDAFADESVMAEATENLLNREWISAFIEEENKKYLPMVIG